MTSAAAVNPVLDSIPHIVWVAAPNGSTTYVNDFCVEYTGHPRAANYRGDWTTLVHPEDAERAERHWRTAVGAGTEFRTEYRIHHHDGSFRWHSFRARPLRNPDGTIHTWVGSATDIHDERRFQASLLTRLVRAREDERAQIAGNIHDDSVQVLAAVDLRMTRLQRKLRSVAPDLTDDVADLRTTLHAATERLRHLLFELETLDASETLVDAVRRAAGYLFADSGVTFTIDDEGVGDVPETQRGQSIRIVKEALINVRDHAAASAVTVRLTRAGHGLEVAVLDNGVGVEEGTASSPPGHRGLSTMRERAEVAGGWWRIERRETGGTAVHFWLPDIGGGDAVLTGSSRRHATRN